MVNVCEFCRNEFSRKSTLRKHYESCKQKIFCEYENLLQTQREQHEHELQTQREQYERELQLTRNQLQNQQRQIEKLETQIFEIAKQPKQINNHSNTKTTNNNQKTLNMINQLAPMNFDQDQKQLQELFQQEFTEEVFFEGPNRITRVVIDNILIEPETGKLRMACTDTSRKHFKYTEGESGEIKTDHGMNRLHELIKKPLVNANMMAYLQTIKDAGENTVEICRNIRERNEEFITSRHMFSDKIISETSK